MNNQSNPYTLCADGGRSWESQPQSQPQSQPYLLSWKLLCSAYKDHDTLPSAIIHYLSSSTDISRKPLTNTESKTRRLLKCPLEKSQCMPRIFCVSPFRAKTNATTPLLGPMRSSGPSRPNNPPSSITGLLIVDQNRHLHLSSNMNLTALKAWFHFTLCITALFILSLDPIKCPWQFGMTKARRKVPPQWTQTRSVNLFRRLLGVANKKANKFMRCNLGSVWKCCLFLYLCHINSKWCSTVSSVMWENY